MSVRYCNQYTAASECLSNLVRIHFEQCAFEYSHNFPVLILVGFADHAGKNVTRP